MGIKINGERPVCSIMLAIWGIGLLIVLAAFRLWVFSVSPGPAGSEVRQGSVPPRTSAGGVARLLLEQGVISEPLQFHLLALLGGVAGRLQSGDYAFPPYSTPTQVLDQIVHGRVYMLKVTFSEGCTMREAAGILEKLDIVSAADFTRIAGDPGVASTLGLTAPGLEGYLFPDTYFFRKKQSALSIVRTMVRQFWRRAPADWEPKAVGLGMNLHQVVIVASIIEKEAVVDSERPLIAAVFYNRLSRGMPLQSDPTAVYDLPGFSGRITPMHLKRESPYNTYHVRGLPAGPICCPGAGSLNAALNPAKVPYLYFASRNDGTHTFSTTLPEHNEAVNRLRELRKESPP